LVNLKLVDGPEQGPDPPAQPPPVYVVKVAIFTPKGRMLGLLESPWTGPHTIGDLCNNLIAVNKERADLDHCRIDVRWVRQRPTLDHPEAGSGSKASG
jgi:hypothetical protein